MLGRSHFVMLGLSQDAQFPQFFVQVLHKIFDAFLNDAKVMVFHFLSLGNLGAKQSTAGINQIFTFFPHSLVHQEIFLFRTHGGNNFFRRHTQDVQDAAGSFVDNGGAPEQRRLLIQHVAGIRTERGRNAQAVILDKSVAGRIPGGVAPGFEGGAQAAGREAGSVRFALD